MLGKYGVGPQGVTSPLYAIDRAYLTSAGSVVKMRAAGMRMPARRFAPRRGRRIRWCRALPPLRVFADSQREGHVTVGGDVQSICRELVAGIVAPRLRPWETPRPAVTLDNGTALSGNCLKLTLATPRGANRIEEICIGGPTTDGVCEVGTLPVFG